MNIAAIALGARSPTETVRHPSDAESWTGLVVFAAACHGGAFFVSWITERVIYG